MSRWLRTLYSAHSFRSHMFDVSHGSVNACSLSLETSPRHHVEEFSLCERRSLALFGESMFPSSASVACRPSFHHVSEHDSLVSCFHVKAGGSNSCCSHDSGHHLGTTFDIWTPPVDDRHSGVTAARSVSARIPGVAQPEWCS